MIQKYYIGLFCFIFCLLLGILNDIVVKLIDTSLPYQEIVFFRYIFSITTLIPLMFYYKTSFKTRYILLHILRGIIIYIAFALWVKGIVNTPISVATTINFMSPIFLLILNIFFLNENISWHRLIGTITGFIGIVIVVQNGNMYFNMHYIPLFIATFFFAILDVINKKYLTKEPIIITLFYSSLFVTLFSIPETINNWTMPSNNELIILIILGTSANFLLFFLLKALSLVEATALSPYRYIEILFSILMGYIFFKDIPTYHTLWGSILILISIVFIFYHEKKIQKNKKLLQNVSV